MDAGVRFADGQGGTRVAGLEGGPSPLRLAQQGEQGGGAAVIGGVWRQTAVEDWTGRWALPTAACPAGRRAKRDLSVHSSSGTPGLVAAQHSVLNVVAGEALAANQVGNRVEPAQPAREGGWLNGRGPLVNRW